MWILPKNVKCEFERWTDLTFVASRFGPWTGPINLPGSAQLNIGKVSGLLRAPQTTPIYVQGLGSTISCTCVMFEILCASHQRVRVIGHMSRPSPRGRPWPAHFNCHVPMLLLQFKIITCCWKIYGQVTFHSDKPKQIQISYRIVEDIIFDTPVSLKKII